MVAGRAQPPRRFRLAYLVTAWTQRPEDEHRLLSSLLVWMLRNPMLKPGELGGSLDEADLPVYIEVGQPETQDRSLADIWSALGGELKPSLDVATAPVVISQNAYYGPPVLTGPTIGLSSSGRCLKRRAAVASGRATCPSPSPPPRRPCRGPARRARCGVASRCGCAAPLAGDDPGRGEAAAADRASGATSPGTVDISLAYLHARIGLWRPGGPGRGGAPPRRRRRPRGPLPRPCISDAQVDALLAGPAGPLVPDEAAKAGGAPGHA